MQHLKSMFAGSLVLITMGALLWGQGQEVTPAGKAMTSAAQAFNASLSKEEAALARFAYDDQERLNWHFIPRERKGLPLRAMDDETRKLAHALLQTCLSDAGYTQALQVMSLEEVLYLLEPGDRDERRERRNPGKYYFSLFGEPALTGSWGFRVEGHHVSLNYVVKDGKVVSSTPEFFGANPGTIAAGPGREIRVLAPEEDLARQILKSCNPEQLKAAWVSKTAPDDLRGANLVQPVLEKPVGLKASEMSGDQKEMLGQLLNEYLKNMPTDVSARREEELRAAGLDNIHFAWWGDQDRDQRHYYVVQGPTFIIEYNNTQNQANHVHSMWRNVAGDFDIPNKK